MAIEDWYGPLTVRHTLKQVDEYGDTTTKYSEPFMAMGYIGRPSSVQASIMGQRGIDVDGRLYAPVGAGFSEFDEIAGEDGSAWQVVSEPRDAGRRGHHVEADLRRLRGGAPDANRAQ